MAHKFGGCVFVRGKDGGLEVVIADGSCHGRIEASEVHDLARLLFGWAGNGAATGHFDFTDEPFDD